MYVEITGDKLCGACHRVLPLTQFSLSEGRPRKDCKECRSKRQIQVNAEVRAGLRPARLKPKKTELPEGMKRCTHCDRVLPLDDFTGHSSTADRRQSYCKPCGADLSGLHWRRRVDRTLRKHPVPAINREWIGWSIGLRCCFVVEKRLAA